ncbi:MAG: VOC family protein [Trueperaceae bacterium]|nr:VOC family protein [Trueperaceae bacterium]
MITGLHHIVLFCGDTAMSKRWYEQVGFAYKRGYEGMHWFALGDSEIMLHPGGEGRSESAPTIHVAVTTLDELFARVKQAGLQPLDHQQPGVSLDAPVVRPWGDREFELQDPDGQWWAFTEAGAAD